MNSRCGLVMRYPLQKLVTLKKHTFHHESGPDTARSNRIVPRMSDIRFRPVFYQVVPWLMVAAALRIAAPSTSNPSTDWRSPQFAIRDPAQVRNPLHAFTFVF